jgi:hypothetical protein
LGPGIRRGDYQSPAVRGINLENLSRGKECRYPHPSRLRRATFPPGKVFGGYVFALAFLILRPCAAPSSVRFAASFSQREKPLVRHRPKAFSLWEKVSPKVTDEGRRRVFALVLCYRNMVPPGMTSHAPTQSLENCTHQILPRSDLPWGEGGAEGDG